VRTNDRKGLQARLSEENIATGIHYPTPLHLQPAYEYLGVQPGTLPVTERIAKEIVSLPMYPELTTTDLEAVVKTATSTPIEV